MKPNNGIDNIREYRVASHEIWDMKPEERKNCLKLDWNEATIQPSPKVDIAIKKLIEDGNFYNLYPKTHNDELVRALGKYTELPDDNILYFASSDSIHEYICRTYLNGHSRVLILSPSYDNFRLTAESFGSEIIYSDMKNDFKINYTIFEQDIENYHPQLVYICNPNNPTGMQISCDYIEKLLKKFPMSMFLIDEAYWEFSGVTAKDLTLNYDNIIISRTMSKAFALANFRFGYILSSKDNIVQINKIRNPKNISTFTQVAVLAALSDVEYVHEYVKEVNKAKLFFYEELQKLPAIGQPILGEGNFMMIRCNKEFSKYEILDYLKENQIYIRDATQRPYVNDCVRISIGNISQMKRVITCLKNLK